MKSKRFLKCFMAQKVSKDIVKIVHVTSVIFIHFMKLREHFLALNVVDVLLSMEGQRALGFHQKYLDLFSEDEMKFLRVWNDEYLEFIFILKLF